MNFESEASRGWSRSLEKKNSNGKSSKATLNIELYKVHSRRNNKNYQLTTTHWHSEKLFIIKDKPKRMKSFFFQFHSSGDKPNITMENEFQSTRVTLRFVPGSVLLYVTNTGMCRWTGRFISVPVLNRVYNFALVCPKKGTHFRTSLLLNSVHDSRLQDLSYALTSWQMISQAFSKSQTLKKIWSCRVRFQVRYQ